MTQAIKTQRNSRKITRDEINHWNEMVNIMAGTNLYYKFVLYKEYKLSSRWTPSTIHSAGIRACYVAHDREKFYLKTIKNRISGEKEIWLYWEDGTGYESERWLLNEHARDFFDCI